MKVKTTSYGVAELEMFRYANDRLAIVLMDPSDGETIATLTVNIPEVPLQEGEFLIKGWSENAEICEDCRRSGLFVDTGKRVNNGWVQAEVWRFA